MKDKQRKSSGLNPNHELLWDCAINSAFEGGHDLRKQLNLSEDNFRFRAPYSHKNPRDIFIYQAIDEKFESYLSQSIDEVLKLIN